MPMLSKALSTYEVLILRWEKLKAVKPDVGFIIQEGLDKLESYLIHTDLTSAYSLAMVMSFTPIQ
jgi:hypothetical protein